MVVRTQGSSDFTSTGGVSFAAEPFGLPAIAMPDMR